MHDIAHGGGPASKSERTAEAKKVTVIGSIVNLALAGIKFSLGVIGGSAAMIADAFHSLSDLVTDAMVYVSISIASQEADEKHPYGHGRAETIGAAATGTALVVAGIGLVFHLADKLMGGDLGIPTWPALAGAMVSIVVKEALYHYTMFVGRKHDNKAIIANAWHHRTDSLSSIAAMLGIGGAMMGFPLLDPLAAIIVVFMIVKVGWEIAWGALQELMDEAAPPEQMEKIEKIISSAAGVHGFHELKTRKLGGDLFVDVHIQVTPNISVSEAHNIAETVRANMRKEAGATDALVHIDAEDDMNYKIFRVDRDEVENRIRTMASEIDGVKGISSLIIHYLSAKAFIEFNVEIDDSVTIGGAKKMVSELREKTRTIKNIHDAAIHAQLTDDPPDFTQEAD